MFIPDPGSGFRIKELFLSFRKNYLGRSGSGIRVQICFLYRIQGPDPGSGSATLGTGLRFTHEFLTFPQVRVPIFWNRNKRDGSLSLQPIKPIFVIKFNCVQTLSCDKTCRLPELLTWKPGKQIFVGRFRIN
jgi:hypothetical protein